MALASVADDGHFLGLDQIDVGITIVIDAHSVLAIGADLFAVVESRMRGQNALSQVLL
jgi:hypothetical protein